MRSEVRLILLASRLSLNATEARELRALVQAGVDWPAVLALAIPHGVLPLVARTLESNAADLLPASLAGQMSSYAERIRSRNEKAAAQLAEVLQAFAGLDIAAAPFKGAALQVAVYGGLPLREFADIDVMIRRVDVPRAVDAMRARGYALKQSQQARIQSVVRKGDALEFSRDGSLTVDLHSRFSNSSFDFDFDPDDLWQELRTVHGGLTIPCYGPETTLLILCAHQARHRWRRLNWICDIAALIQTNRGMDWGSALERAREFRCERIVLATVGLAETLLDPGLPDVVRSRLLEDRGACALAERLAPGILDGPRKTRWLYVRMREGNSIAGCGRYIASKLRFRLA
jgi:hypothetical protein